METLRRRPNAAGYMLRLDAAPPPSIDVRRTVATYAPALATAALTAAVFLLPATGQRLRAQAGIDDVRVSATHMKVEGAPAITLARR